MNAGRLRHWITIQRTVREPNAHGQLVDTWRDFWSGNASIETLAAAETGSGRQLKATASHSITTRYVPGVVPLMRVRYGSRTFNIESATDKDFRGVELLIMATEKL